MYFKIQDARKMRYRVIPRYFWEIGIRAPLGDGKPPTRATGLHLLIRAYVREACRDQVEPRDPYAATFSSISSPREQL